MQKDIKLIKLQKKHLEKVRKWRNSEEVSQYLYSTKKITREEQESWYKTILNDTSRMCFMIEYDKKELGIAYLYNINYIHRNCYWAFYLGDTSVRGKGVGSKVEYNVIQYVFDKLNMNKLLCEVFVFNEKVIKMHEGFGFRRESYFREHIFKNEQFYDVVGLALLKKEWQQFSESMKIYQ